MISVRNTRLSQRTVFSFFSLLLSLQVDLAQANYKKSVGVIVSNHYLKKIEETNKYLFTGQSVQERFQGCYKKKEKNFSSASCTGVLISPKHFLTAGHCVSNIKKFCDNHSIIFDYYKSNFKYHPFKNSQEYYSEKILENNKDMFKCTTVLFKKFKQNQEDIAIIELEEITNRRPIKISNKKFRSFRSIGSHLGLPMTISKKLDSRHKSIFKTIHSFSLPIATDRGASGGPIINERGELTGIIISSIQEYSYDEELMTCEHTQLDKVPVISIIMSSQAIEKNLSYFSISP